MRVYGKLPFHNESFLPQITSPHTHTCPLCMFWLLSLVKAEVVLSVCLSEAASQSSAGADGHRRHLLSGAAGSVAARQTQ